MLFISCKYDPHVKFESAVQRNNLKEVEQLLKDGVEASGDMYKKQPLEIAVENDNIEMFLFLLENGADLKRNNYEIVSYLVNSYNKRCLEELVRRRYITTQFRILAKGYSVFYWASMQQDSRFLVNICDGNQNLNEIYETVPVLKNLIDNYSEDVLDSIIPDGIHDGDLNNTNFSPLGYALAKDKTKTAALLIHKGFSFNMMDENPWMYVGIYWTPNYDTIINVNEDALISIKDADSGLISGYIFNNNYSKADRFRLIERAVAAGVSPNKPDREGKDTWYYINTLGYLPSIDFSESNEDEYREEQRRYGDEIRVFLKSLNISPESK
jgi:ankyrin repeat protein